MDFYESQTNKDRFEIIAFHDESVKNLEELDQRLAPIKKNIGKAKI